MPYFYLIASVFFIASSSIFGSFFNRKNEGKRDPAQLYNVLLIVAALIGWWIIYAFDFSFNPMSLVYSLIFAVGYAVADIGIIFALATGPVSLTALILQLSLIGATVWGFIFWNEVPTWLTWIGLVLVVIAIALCLFAPSKKGSNKNPITLKWIIFAAMAFFGNVACTVAQKTHQIDFGGAHGSMMMAFAMIIALVIFVAVYLFSDKRDTHVIAKTSWFFPAASGAGNVLLNLFIIMLAATELPPSLIYPVLSVGGIMITSMFSAFFLKEKLYPWQWCGIGVGAVAIVALSV